MTYIIAGALCACAIFLAVIAITLVALYRHGNRKGAKVEGKIVADSRRIIWRITNTGVRNIVIVEIGIKCGDMYSSYRPLYAQSDDINNIPHLIERGDIASYRKEMERFTFRQSEVDLLKIANPNICFYAKDAEGKTYVCQSEYKFVQYLTLLLTSN